MGSQRSTAAAERVVLARRASDATPELAEEAVDAVPGRKALADHSVRYHVRIGEHRPAAGERGAAGVAGVAPPVEVGDDVRHAAGVHDADRHVVEGGRKAREVGLRAHDRERAPVDLVRVAEVVAGRAHRGLRITCEARLGSGLFLGARASLPARADT